MANENTQFKKDLANPSSGLNSDLYNAISPIISGIDSSSLSKEDQSKIDRLREDVRKGVVGLEYMTGLKKNKEESFYDEHPVQAVATDLLGKSPLLGLGLTGGGMLLNSVKQKQDLDKVMPAAMARAGNTPDKDLSNPRALLNPADGKIRGDISKIYGSEFSSPRMNILDRLSDITPGDPGSLSSAFEKLERLRIKQVDDYDLLNGQLQKKLMRAFDDKDANRITKQIAGAEKVYQENLKKIEQGRNELLALASETKGAKYLDKHVNFHEALSRAKEKGGFSSPLGAEWNLPEFIAPDKHQRIVDLLERMELTKEHPGFDRELVLQSVADHLDNPAELAKFEKYSLPKIMSPEHQKSGLRRFLSRHKLPLAAGAATAVGGTGLYYLIKALQDKMYSDKKINDWKKTILKSKGDFESANQLQ
jgi:hypothetical protein